MSKAWRVYLANHRFYAQYTTNEGESWTSAPPDGLGSAEAAHQLIQEMKRKHIMDEASASGGETGLTEDEEAALLKKFDGREGELEDDMASPESKREERLREWHRYLVEHGLENDEEVA